MHHASCVCNSSMHTPVTAATLCECQAAHAIGQRSVRTSSKGQYEALVETWHHFLVALSAKARVHIHSECVELGQGVEGAKQVHNNTSPLNCLYCARQQVGRKRFKVLQHQHAKGVSQHFVRVRVVAIPYAGGSYKHCILGEQSTEESGLAISKEQCTSGSRSSLMKREGTCKHSQVKLLSMEVFWTDDESEYAQARTSRSGNPPEKGSSVSGFMSPRCISFFTCFMRFFLWLLR